MNHSEIYTIIGTGVGIVGLIYMIVRNFKQDMYNHIDRLDERMFQLSTGKTIAQALKEEKMKKEEGKW